MLGIQSIEPERADGTPVRSAPFEMEPGFYAPAGLWLYGNVRLLTGELATVPETFGPEEHSPVDLDRIERDAERIVLAGKVLVCGMHSAAHQRAALVPLRWGAPRIMVMSGGFFHHLGRELKEEPFRTARLWRYAWDARTDLAVSRRAPDKMPTFAKHNPTVDGLIARLASGNMPGELFAHRRKVDGSATCGVVT